MPFSPSRGSQDTLVTLTGQSLFTTTGIYLISGSTRGQATIVSTGNSLVTFYPPSTPPGDLRSGQWQLFNKFGSATTTDYFTWINTPFLSGFVPGSGFTGYSIRLTGSGIRDLTGLYFLMDGREYTGVLSSAVFESNTWIRTGYVPFISGSLNAYARLMVMSEGGSHSPSQLFFIREGGLSLSGLVDFPSPFQAHNYLRGNSTANALEWRTPNQVLNDITGLLKSGGDHLTGNYSITGGVLSLTGLRVNDSDIPTIGHHLTANSGQLYWSGSKVLIQSGTTEDGIITYNKDYPNTVVESGVKVSGSRIVGGQLKLDNTDIPFDQTNVFNALSGKLYWSGQLIGLLSGNNEDGIVTYNKDYPNINVETGVKISGSRIDAGQLRLDNTSIPFDQTNVLNVVSGKLYWSGQLLGLLSGNSEDGIVTYNKDYPNINVETGVKISGGRIELNQARLANSDIPFDPTNVLSTTSGKLYWSGQLLALLSGNSEDGVVTYNKDYPNVNVETGVKISGQRIELGQLRIANSTTPFDPTNVVSASGGLLMWTGGQVAMLPTPVQPHNYLRENANSNALEWRTPNQLLNDITGVLKSGGDVLTGNYCISGGELCLTGLKFHGTGLATGDVLWRTRLFSGNTILMEAVVGGVIWRGFSYKFS